jgi:hypothetical protein
VIATRHGSKPYSLSTYLKAYTKGGVYMELKICFRCKKELPRNLDYFPSNKSRKDGLSPYCKKCLVEYKQEHRKKNKEQIRKHKQEYYLKAKEHIQEYQQANREHILENKREHHRKNREQEKAYRREYLKNNLDKYRIWNKRRSARIKGLQFNYSSEIWENAVKYFDNKCAYCGEEKPLQQEHFIALSKGGEYTVNNIIPACLSCNDSKRDSDFFDWYHKKPFYSKKREKKILKYLDYKNGIQQLKLSV